MKIVFLDFDGVMVTHRSARLPLDYSQTKVGLEQFSLRAIQALTEIVETTDAKIVISSDWKHNLSKEVNNPADNFTDEEWHQIVIKHLRKQGIEAEVVGFTPDMRIEGTFSMYGGGLMNSTTRSMEIDTFIKDNGITEFVILDDLEIMTKESKKHHIRTNHSDGLNNTHVQRAIEILNMPKETNEISK